MGFLEMSQDIARKIQPDIETDVVREKAPVWNAVAGAFVDLAGRLRDDPQLRTKVEESEHISQWLVEQMERYPVVVDVEEKSEKATARRTRKNKTTQAEEEVTDSVTIQRVKAEPVEIKKARRIGEVRKYFLGESGAQGEEKKSSGTKKKIIVRQEPDRIYIDYKVIAPLAIVNLKRSGGEYPPGSSITQNLAWAEINEEGLVYLKRNTFYPNNPDGSPQLKSDGTRITYGTETIEVFEDPEKFTQEEVVKVLDKLLGLNPSE